tara:strand:- start:17 stop:1204 length:1188 start_codon:yes stop_codon:yes gene_type:complete
MEEKLIAQIDDDKIKYAVFQKDEKMDYELISKKISYNVGVNKGKISDFEYTAKIINEDLHSIEKEVDKVFKSIHVILNQEDIFCTNLTGFKKLNGSKVEKRDLDYILNEAKNSIDRNKEKNSILHILNSNFILDKTKQDKMPLNIFGDHLSLHMTFISIPNNNLKNIKAIFNYSDLKVERIISRPFVEGIHLLNQNKDLKNFIIINLENELSTISLYDSSSLIFLKTFPFGTNSIYKDITQLCSLKREEIELIINDLNFNNLNENKTKYIDKRFFIKSDFKKLSIQHIQNIIDARVKEIINYTFNRNKNLNYLEDKISNIYLIFKNKDIFRNLENLFEKSLNIDPNKTSIKSSIQDDFGPLLGAAELIFKGWHKEAIPFSNKKKSVISSFFERFF